MKPMFIRVTFLQTGTYNLWYLQNNWLRHSQGQQFTLENPQLLHTNQHLDTSSFTQAASQITEQHWVCSAEIATETPATSGIANDDKWQDWKFYKMPVFHKLLNLCSQLSAVPCSVSKKQQTKKKVFKIARVGHRECRSSNTKRLSGQMNQEMQINWANPSGKSSQRFHALKQTNPSNRFCEYYWLFD